jgi:hypothetical protein
VGLLSNQCGIVDKKVEIFSGDLGVMANILWDPKINE